MCRMQLWKPSRLKFIWMLKAVFPEYKTCDKTMWCRSLMEQQWPSSPGTPSTTSMTAMITCLEKVSLNFLWIVHKYIIYIWTRSRVFKRLFNDSDLPKCNWNKTKRRALKIWCITFLNKISENSEQQKSWNKIKHYMNSTIIWYLVCRFLPA